MALTFARGTKLGPYQIDAPIGAGGMVRPTRRPTPAWSGRSPSRSSRPSSPRIPSAANVFEREAKAIAALNHPHICTLYEFDSHEGIDFLVMEHLEGESLQDRLKKGPLPHDYVLRIAIQIADALDKAHRQGITHRDVKPGNIFLIAAGGKLLDFGLAKISQTAGSEAPTKAAESLTAQGVIVGTFHYMAPELLEGQAAKPCTDIWAFGCVLYEMLTGRKLFDGESIVEVVAAVSSQNLTWERIPDSTPSELIRLLRRCVQRDVDRRLQHIADVKLELLDARDELDRPEQDATSGPLETRQVVALEWTLSREVCRHLSRENFDAAMIGDHVEYLDNERASGRLVVYLPPVGMDHSIYRDVLESSPYRGIALTPYGMEPTRPRRIPLPIADHFTIIRLFLEHLSEDVGATHTILTSFSSGADLGSRLISEGGATKRHIDGLLSLGPNLDMSNCF